MSELNATNSQVTPVSPEFPTKKSSLLPLLVGAVIGALIFGLLGFYIGRMSLLPVGPSQPESISQKSDAAVLLPDGSTSAFPTTQPTSKEHVFTHAQFSMTYPEGWVVSDVATHPELSADTKERLNWYNQGDASRLVGFTKNGLLLAISISPLQTKPAPSGGFTSETQLQEHLDRTVPVSIAGSTNLYLYDEVSTYPSTTDGDGGFGGSLIELFDSTKPGVFYKEYADLIWRNGYRYDFYLFDADGGVVDPALKQELIQMLETIRW